MIQRCPTLKTSHNHNLVVVCNLMCLVARGTYSDTDVCVVVLQLANSDPVLVCDGCLLPRDSVIRLYSSGYSNGPTDPYFMTATWTLLSSSILPSAVEANKKHTHHNFYVRVVVIITNLSKVSAVHSDTHLQTSCHLQSRQVRLLGKVPTDIQYSAVYCGNTSNALNGMRRS